MTLLRPLKNVGLVALLLALAAGTVRLHGLQQHLEEVQTQKMQLTVHNTTLAAQLREAAARTVRLSAALETQQQRYHHQEEQNETLRQRLRRAAVASPCAGQPVPDAVIRLQRDALAAGTLPR